MLFAVDKYQVGIEKEIAAKSLFGQYIPNKKKRFFCPECGGQVFWRSRGGSNPDMFYHEKKTDFSPECDKRIDGKSGLYLYQRIGLPMYICKSGCGWKLELGFPALGNELLCSAAAKNTVVVISAGKDTCRKTVDCTNFYSDKTTRIPVDIVPSGNEKYIITIQSSGVGYIIRQKWSDYADGIGDGAIFQYSESGGKRVKQGDSICPEKEYFLIAKKFNSPFSEIEAKQVDHIFLSEQKYNIYVITIHISSSRKEQYRHIDEYLKSIYGVGLLDIVPTLIPLWPPVVEQDVWIPANEKKEIICAVSSSNDTPTVYQYQGNSVIELPVIVDENGNKSLNLSVSSTEKIVSVDRKYVGREQGIKLTCIEPPIFSREFRVFYNNTEINLDSLTENILSAASYVISNYRQEIAFQDKHYNFQVVKIKEAQTNLPERFDAIALYLLCEGSVIKKYDVLYKISESLLPDEGETIKALKMHNVGCRVVAPSWLTSLISEYSRQGYGRVAKYLKQCIMQKRITIGLLQELRNIGNRGGL